MTYYDQGPLNYATPDLDAKFSGWRTGAMVFGIITLFIAAISGCLGIFAPFAMFMQPGGPFQSQAMMAVGVALLYLTCAAGLLWLGIGTIRMQRWVRPIMLTLSSISFVVGVCSVISMIAMLGGMSAAVPPPGPNAPPQGVLMVGMVFGIVFVGFIMLIVPAAYVLFFRSPHVKELLEHFDPTPRWTDNCPTPALGVSITLALFAGMGLMASPMGVFAFFGRMLTGWSASIVQLIVALLAFALARSTFKLQSNGWWLTMGFVIFIGASYTMTSLTRNPADLQPYGFHFHSNPGNQGQTAAMRQMQSLGPAARVAMTAPIYLAMICYLLIVRKYFTNDPAAAQPSIPIQ